MFDKCVADEIRDPNKTYICLHRQTDPVLIVPATTGIVYYNQTGGCLCNHPEMEGYLIPLKPDPGATIFNPTRWYQEIYLDLDNKDTIQEIECALNYDRYSLAQNIRVCRACPNDEAWVWIECELQGVGRVEAILTWENSD